jgi:hypothetical protein
MNQKFWEKFEYLVAEKNKELSQFLRAEEKINLSRGSLLADASKQKYLTDNYQIFPKIFVIRDESKIVYLSHEEEDLKCREAGLIKAQLFIKLVEDLKFPLKLVELGRYVKIEGRESKRYIEADIILNDRRGNVEMIFEITPFADFEKNADMIIADLFALAESLSWMKKPNYLVYYSRSCKNGEVKEKIITIDYHKFNSFGAWKKSNRLSESKIPDRAEE